MGLAGMYQLHDPLEQSLKIPQGEYDVPLIVGDTMFANDGKILFSSIENKGFYGDVITVNGTPWPVMKVARRKYRFRILNASAAGPSSGRCPTGPSWPSSRPTRG